jgi:hypothetical protein
LGDGHHPRPWVRLQWCDVKSTQTQEETQQPVNKPQPEGNPQDKFSSGQPQGGSSKDERTTGNQQEGSLKTPQPHEVDVKATKADDAAIDEVKWKERLCRVLGQAYTSQVKQAVEVLRGFVLRLYQRRVTQSYFCWLHATPRFQPCGIGMDRVVELEQLVTPQGSCNPNEPPSVNVNYNLVQLSVVDV